MKLSTVALCLTISNVAAFAPLSTHSRTNRVVLNGILGQEGDFTASLDKDVSLILERNIHTNILNF